MKSSTTNDLGQTSGGIRKHEGVGALKTAEAATYLGIGRTAFYHLVKEGKIPFTVVGKERAKLYRIADLDEFLRPKTTIEKLMAPIIQSIREEYGYYGK